MLLHCETKANQRQTETWSVFQIQEPEATATKILREIKSHAKYHYEKCKKKNEKKYNLCRRKQETERSLEGVPKETKPFIQGINIFEEEVKPEDPRGPMVCSTSIKLSENEMAFLNKGPRYMMTSSVYYL